MTWLIDSTPAGNVLAPEEQPTFTFLFRNNTAAPIQADAHLDVLSYGTREIPGDIWTPDLFKIADLPPIPITVNLPAHGSQVIKVEAKLPSTLGAYAFVGAGAVVTRSVPEHALVLGAPARVVRTF